MYRKILTSVIAGFSDSNGVNHFSAQFFAVMASFSKVSLYMMAATITDFYRF